MDFIKKNIAIIVPAGIAFVAILVFIPTCVIRARIRTNTDKSISQAESIESLTRMAPSARQYEIVKNYQDQHQQDANEIAKLAKQSTQRELLSYKIFPKPNESSQQIFGEFRQNYTKVFEDLILKKLGALDCPTDAEIQKASGTSVSTSKGYSSNKKSGQDEKIVSLIYKKRAETIPVYAHPKVLSGYNFWEEWNYQGVESATKDCWYCQVSYWIQKDVVDSISAINSGSASVFDSPVKRLLGISFQSLDAMGNNNGFPSYVTDTATGLIPSWTGRVCNDDIDVVHFSVAVVVRSKDMLRFMQQLCGEKDHLFSGYNGNEPEQSYKHNQITILQSDIEMIDLDSPEHNCYRYGEEAVIRLNLICEYIFNRSGYDKMKPDSIKQDLGQAQEAKKEQPKTKGRARSKRK